MLELTAGTHFGVLGLFGLPGHWEIVIIVLAILLLFGAKKLPEMARGLARGLRTFKDELKGIDTDVKQSTSDEDAPEATSPDADQQEEPPPDEQG